jgi:predicted AAA+ superfamily ATPase
MIPRTAAETLKILARGYPVVAVTGPRQSGKTTLVRAAFPQKPYVSLEDPDQREFAQDDPRRFLGRFADGAVLDEVQRCPALFSYLQGRVDEDRRSGLFILTGSQQFGLLSGVTQTLAGRVGFVPLLPFSLPELQAAAQAPTELDELLYRGQYPPLYDRDVSPLHWHADYVTTYVERDVRQMVNVQDLTVFQRFIRLCAGRTGQLLNLSSLANDAGIATNTARAWLSVLEASYLVYLLPPHHRNFRKRLVKSPKLYFVDSGLAAWLLGIQDAGQLSIHAMRGALFENWVITELLKQRFNRALVSNLYFWRDNTGNEIDVLLDEAGSLRPIEVKSGQTMRREYLAGLKKWCDLAEREDTSTGRAALVYGGGELQRLSDVDIVPWRDINSLHAQG